MTTRPLPGWWASYSVAVLAALAWAGAVWSLFASGVARPAAAALPLPGLWLMAAAFLSRGTGRPLAVATGAASGLAACVSGLLVFHVTSRYHGVRPRSVTGLGMESLEQLTLAQFPLALVVLIANAVGWWRRRQERFAADSFD